VIADLIVDVDGDGDGDGERRFVLRFTDAEDDVPTTMSTSPVLSYTHTYAYTAQSDVAFATGESVRFVCAITQRMSNAAAAALGGAGGVNGVGGVGGVGNSVDVGVGVGYAVECQSPPLTRFADALLLFPTMATPTYSFSVVKTHTTIVTSPGRFNHACSRILCSFIYSFVPYHTG
jgi:hypothetical protein